MTARRSPGDGSVIKTSNGRWAAVLEVPTRRGGKRKRVWRRAGTKSEATRLLREMRDELQRSGGVSSAGRSIAEAIEAYVRLRENSAISDGTMAHDAWLAGLAVQGLGQVRLNELSVQDCDDFLSECAEGLMDCRRPIGRSQIGRVRAFLAAVLRNEIHTGQLSRNVALSAELPGRSRAVVHETDQIGSRRALTVDELQAFIARIVLADLTGRNGLRPGEAQSLRWSDIDIEAGELSVRSQVDRQNRRTMTKRRVRNATRTIRIDHATVDRLAVSRSEQLELRSAAGPAWQDLDVVASTAGAAGSIGIPGLARSARSVLGRASTQRSTPTSFATPQSRFKPTRAARASRSPTGLAPRKR